MAGKDVFDAVVRARDESTPVLEQIERHYEKLGKEINRAEDHVKHYGERVETVHRSHLVAFERMGEHVEGLKEHFKGLGESVSHVGETFSELLPALTALGAAASVAGIWETVSRAAEHYGELAHSAGKLGANIRDLQLLQVAAKLADTDVEALGKSIGHLNRVMSDVEHGQNPGVAALFHQIHLDPSRYASGIDALPDLAQSFHNTTNAKLRNKMAFALFGKSGEDAIPFLLQGREEVRKHLEEASKLVPDLSKYPGLDKYNENMKGLGIATGGFMDSLGAKLEPALDPIIEKLKDSIAEHREAITDNLTKGVIHFAESVEKVDFEKFFTKMEHAADDLGSVANHLGVVTRSIEILAGLTALKLGYSLVEPVIKVGGLAIAAGGVALKVGGEVYGAWRGAAAAARGAGAVGEGAAEAASATHPITSAMTEEGRAALAARQASIADRVRASLASEAASRSSVFARVAAGAGTFAKRTAGFLLGPELGVGFLVHALDSGDLSGRMIDKYVPGAAALDHWINRQTGGLVGRPDDGISTLDLPARALTWPGSSTPIASSTPPLSTSRSRDGELRIRIDLPNMPPDARIETQATGNVGPVNVNLGRAFDEYP